MKYQITIKTPEYNPIKHAWEDRFFTGEFSGSSERAARSKARRTYAESLDTDKEEIEIMEVVPIMED